MKPEIKVKTTSLIIVILAAMSLLNGCGMKPEKSAKLPGYIVSADLADTLQTEILEKMSLLNKEMKDGKDPSFESVSAIFPRMKYPPALVGVKEHMGKYLVTWDGMILCDPLHVSFRVGNDTVPFGRVKEENVSRFLLDGYLPVVTTTYSYDGVQYEETVFGYSENQSTENPQVAFIRMSISNPSAVKKETKLSVSFRKITGKKDIPLSYQLKKEGGNLLDPDGKVVFFSGQEEGKLEDNTLTFGITLDPRQEKKMYFSFPHLPVTASNQGILSNPSYDVALEEVRQFWQGVMDRGMQVNVPEEIVNNAYKTWLINNFILAEEDKSRDYYEVHDAAFAYEFVFGYAAALSMNTLITRGYFEEAKKYADMFIKLTWPNGGFSGERLFVPHQNGGIIYMICQLYRVTNDEEWFKKVVPQVIRSCNLIIEDRSGNKIMKNGQKPVTYGLLSPYRYCEDEVGKSTIVQEYLGNAWCWAGLEQASKALAQLGGEYLKESVRLKKEADEYRADIFSSMEKAMIKENGLTFLPVAVSDTIPYKSLQESVFSHYYNILSPRLLESEIFDTDDAKIHLIPDFLEQRDGLILGLSRWYGFGGIDPHFISGYALTNLRLNDIDKFLLTFYSLLSYGMARETFSTQECSFIIDGTANYGNVGPEHWYSSRQPHLHSSSEMIRLLHMLLLKEEKDEVWITWGTPRKWLEDGKKIEVRKIQTSYGPFDFIIKSRVSEGYIQADLKTSLRESPAVIRLKLRHPEGKTIRKVEINGKEYKDFKGEVINIRPTDGMISILARY